MGAGPKQDRHVSRKGKKMRYLITAGLLFVAVVCGSSVPKERIPTNTALHGLNQSLERLENEILNDDNACAPVYGMWSIQEN